MRIAIAAAFGAALFLSLAAVASLAYYHMRQAPTTEQIVSDGRGEMGQVAPLRGGRQPRQRQPPDAAGQYRLALNITSVPWSPALSDRRTEHFSALANRLQRALQHAYERVQGDQYFALRRVVESHSSVGFVSELDMTSTADNGVGTLRAAFESAVKLERALGEFSVSPEGSSFIELAEARPCRGSEWFACADRSCVLTRFVCDAAEHCKDGSDESLDYAGCRSEPYISFVSGNVTVLLGKDAQLEAIVKNFHAANVIWQRPPDEILTVNEDVFTSDGRFDVRHDAFTGRFTLLLKNATGKDAGAYELHVDSAAGSESAAVHLHVADDYRPTGAKEKVDRNEIESPWLPQAGGYVPEIVQGHHDGRKCPSGFRPCKSGHCLEEHRWCDGRPECPDQDDEHQCGAEHQLAVDESRQVLVNPELTRRACDRRYEFACALGGACVPKGAVCDGRRDCTDGSDESDSQCARQEHNQLPTVNHNLDTASTRLCPDGREPELSVHGALYCWKQFDCPKHTKCTPINVKTNDRLCCKSGGLGFRCSNVSQWQCANGKCIDWNRRCDYSLDCDDGSDELTCDYLKKSVDTRCDADQHKCAADGKCIAKEQLCDGYADCADESDETNCTDKEVLKVDKLKACDGVKQFRCASGDCVPRSAVCNGQFECADRTDELVCDQSSDTISSSSDTTKASSPPPAELAIGQQGYYPYDGRNPCDDRTEFHCHLANNCIDVRRRCDGRADCQFGEDEGGCAPYLASSESVLGCFFWVCG